MAEVRRFKKISCFCMACFGMLLLMSGCGRKSVDYNIDGNGTDTSVALGPLAAEYGIPVSVDTGIDCGASGLSSITVKDDSITIPSGDSMKIAHYTVKTMDADKKQRIMETLLDKDAGIYSNEYEDQSKEMLQKELDTAKRDKQEAEARQDEENAAGYEMEISSLTERMENAPEEPINVNGDYSKTEYIGTKNGEDYRVEIYSEYGYYIDYTRMNLSEYRPYTGKDYITFVGILGDASIDVDTTELQKENQCNLSEEQAQAVADDFLESVGVTDMTLKNAGTMYWEYRTFDSRNYEADGYIFNYAKYVNGQQVSDKDIVYVENLEDAIEELPALQLEDWCTIYVDANGIVSATISESLEPTGEEEPASLLSFGKLLERANETIGAYYQTYPTIEQDLAFDQVELTYYVKEDPENDTGILYVPAWIFSQKDPSGEDPEQCPYQMVVLDATDGSVIDVVAVSKRIQNQLMSAEE